MLSSEIDILTFLLIDAKNPYISELPSMLRTHFHHQRPKTCINFEAEGLDAFLTNGEIDYLYDY